MKKYHQRDLKVFAFQWESHEDTPNEHVKYFARPDMKGNNICGHCDLPYKEHGWIDEGNGRTVCPNDWVICVPNFYMKVGTHYPIKPNVMAYLFNETIQLKLRSPLSVIQDEVQWSVHQDSNSWSDAKNNQNFQGSLGVVINDPNGGRR